MFPKRLVRSYQIAGLEFQIACDENAAYRTEGFLEGYEIEETNPDHRVSVSRMPQLPTPEGAVAFHAEDQIVYRENGRVQLYSGAVRGGVAHASVCTIRDGDQIGIIFRDAYVNGEISARLILNAIDLPHLLTIHNGFLLHASFIEHEGGAILFTAPSETGKSTQAQLWCDHAGAALVNGDRAAVRIIDGEVFACGTPFSGSSPVRRNVILPLKAIVYLSQAAENSICRLKGVRAFRRVWEGCTVNFWDRSDLELATNTVSGVVSRIPVYHLACTPDVRAVEVLKNTLEVEL